MTMHSVSLTSRFWIIPYFLVFSLSFAVAFDGWKLGSNGLVQWSNGCDFLGKDIRNEKTKGDECGGKCASQEGCSHFTWNSWEGGTCWMKGSQEDWDHQAVSNTDIETICGFVVSRQGSGSTSAGVTGNATFYHVSDGTTACGQIHSDGDMIVAIGFPYWTADNPNFDPNCHKTAWVRDSTNGNTITVAIVDKCESCGSNNVDLSPAAFQQFRNLDVGLFGVVWGING